MIASIHILQEIFAIDVLRALKPSLKHDCKHVLRLLRLYGDQAKELSNIFAGFTMSLCMLKLWVTLITLPPEFILISNQAWRAMEYKQDKVPVIVYNWWFGLLYDRTRENPENIPGWPIKSTPVWEIMPQWPFVLLFKSFKILNDRS